MISAFEVLAQSDARQQTIEDALGVVQTIVEYAGTIAFAVSAALLAGRRRMNFVGVIVFEVIFAFANFFEHGNINLPLRVERALGRLFITPALHRRHHSRESRMLDTNYGTIFSFWDRLLGSYGDNHSNVKVDTGLPGIDGALGTVEILALPARGVFRGA